MRIAAAPCSSKSVCSASIKPLCNRFFAPRGRPPPGFPGSNRLSILQRLNHCAARTITVAPVVELHLDIAGWDTADDRALPLGIGPGCALGAQFFCKIE